MQLYINLLYELSVIISAAGSAVCGICLSQVGFSHFTKAQKRLSRIFFSSVLVFLLSSLVWDILNQFYFGEVNYYLMRTLSFTQYLAAGVMTFVMFHLILSLIDPQEYFRGVKLLMLILLAVHVVMLVVSQFTDLYYYYQVVKDSYIWDDRLVDFVAVFYFRSDLFFLSYLPPMLMLGTSAVMLMLSRRQFKGKLKAALWIFIFAPAVGAILQLFFDDIYFISITTVAATAYFFNVLHRLRAEENLRQQMEASRLETELSTAARIQADMLPRSFPAFPDKKEFDIFASMKPAKEVGGDFYDFFLIDEDHLGLVMADVSDKGIPAALFMMTSMTAIQNYAKLRKSPGPALEEANAEICRNNGEDMFVTVWLGILDIKTGVLTAVDAGHEYPAVKHSDGSFELLKNKHGLYIGYMDTVKYTEYEIRLEKGAKLFLYTDGVTEATDAGNELFGFDRLTEVLRSAENGTPQEILSAVDEAVKNFVGDAPQFDDLTMMCLSYNGTGPE